MMLGNSIAVKQKLFILSNERVQDIDTYDDWTIAELKFQLINGRVK